MTPTVQIATLHQYHDHICPARIKNILKEGGKREMYMVLTPQGQWEGDNITIPYHHKHKPVDTSWDAKPQ